MYILRRLGGQQRRTARNREDRVFEVRSPPADRAADRAAAPRCKKRPARLRHTVLAMDEVLSLGKIAPKIRVSKFVAAADCSEGSLRNWLINPPKPPQTGFEKSARLLHVLQTEDSDFHLPVSEAASRQIMHMRANMEERRYATNQSLFMRTYALDMQRWREILRKNEAADFEESDWDTVLCCFYYQLNLTYCKVKGDPGPDPETWDALTQKLAQMADAGMREATSIRTEAFYHLIKVSLLWRRTQFWWHRLSRNEKPSEKERDSNREILAQTEAHIRRYDLFDETVNLSRDLPDFVPTLFSAIAVASRLRDAGRYSALRARLHQADNRFDRTWFENALDSRHSGTQHAKPLFAARFIRLIDDDFADFVRWLRESGDAGPEPRGAGQVP